MALVDADGLPTSVIIAPGNRHDVSLVDETLDAAFVKNLSSKLIADKAFDSTKLQENLRKERDVDLIAPKRGGKRPSKRKQDGRAMRRYRKRWKVENLFAWLKQFRRIAVRWERQAEHYLGFVHLGCMVVLLRTAW